MNFDCYLFDFDNCLLEIPNTFHYFNNVLLDTLRNLNLNHIPSKKERNEFWFSNENYINLLKSWGIENEPSFWSTFDRVDFEKRKNFLAKRRITLYDDVMPVLETLRESNKYLGIISNTAEYVVRYIMEELDIIDFFHYIFGMGNNRNQDMAKPSPYGILMTLENLSCQKELSQVLMIGDSSADILAAKRAKVNSCLILRESDKFQSGYSNWEYKPDFIINDLREILNI
ncbi:MAG: HAD family hydrolase [Candidatus Lokiarchaeota archaeon]